MSISRTRNNQETNYSQVSQREPGVVSGHFINLLVFLAFLGAVSVVSSSFLIPSTIVYKNCSEEFESKEKRSGINATHLDT